MQYYNISDVCVNVSKLEDLDPLKVMNIVKEHTFAVIRGLFLSEELKESLEITKKSMSRLADHPAIGESPRSIMENYQKIVVGGGAQKDFYVPRCARIAYNPIWSEDIYGMKKHFITLARARNILLSKPIDFAVHEVENDGFWTAARLQHYPAGGGFFLKHRDAVLEKHNQDAGMEKFIQILLLVTQKGEDFKEGGAFIEIEGKNVNLEDNFGRGDIIIYDGRSNHGVEDIDTDHILDFNSVNGRIAALASLYSDFSKTS